MDDFWSESPLGRLFQKKNVQEILENAGITPKKGPYNENKKPSSADTESQHAEKTYYSSEHQYMLEPDDVTSQKTSDAEAKKAQKKLQKKHVLRIEEEEKKKASLEKDHEKEREDVQMELYPEEAPLAEEFDALSPRAKKFFRHILDNEPGLFEYMHKLAIHQDQLVRHEQPTKEEQLERLKETLEYQLMPSDLGNHFMNDDEEHQEIKRQEEAKSWQRRVVKERQAAALKQQSRGR